MSCVSVFSPHSGWSRRCISSRLPRSDWRGNTGRAEACALLADGFKALAFPEPEPESAGGPALPAVRQVRAYLPPRASGARSAHQKQACRRGELSSHASLRRIVDSLLRAELFLHAHRSGSGWARGRRRADICRPPDRRARENEAHRRRARSGPCNNTGTGSPEWSRTEQGVEWSAVTIR